MVDQALWQGVTGDNPSSFHRANFPVDQVSYDDILQQFLPRLMRLLPTMAATLPTEAQWEYACRAGTTTPFSFGDVLTTDLANYAGGHPYTADQPVGEYRGGTVPVDEFSPNSWGLFQMHGNVWEWCRDGERLFEAGQSVIDPIGPNRGRMERLIANTTSSDRGKRALRGGVFHRGGSSLRSAKRNFVSSGWRSSFASFRIAVEIESAELVCIGR